jgi:protein-disulfide isomerase
VRHFRGTLADRAYNVEVPTGIRAIATAVLGVALIASALPVAWAQTSPPAGKQTPPTAGTTQSPPPGRTPTPSAPGAEDPALTAIRSDLERVREELAGVRAEVKALRELLQRLAAPSQPPARVTATVTTGDNPALGRRDAPVTIVEFSDYQCPFCRQFVTTTLPALKSTYVDAGKLRWVFRDFPLDQIHPNARKASEAARCAGDQGKYWDMHDLLFQNQQALAAEQLPTYADRLGLDRAAFGACLSSGKYAAAVQKNFGDGAAAGVRGTPSFVIGRTRPDDTVEGLLLTGARPLADFRQEIDRLLSEK